MTKLMKIKEPKKLKPVLDENKIARLIRAIPTQGFYNIRDRAMITLLWDTAIRLNEALTIELANVDFIFRTIKIRGKGDKERVVPIGQKAKSVLTKYLKFREKIDSQLLFCTRDGLKISR